MWRVHVIVLFGLSAPKLGRRRTGPDIGRDGAQHRREESPKIKHATHRTQSDVTWTARGGPPPACNALHKASKSLRDETTQATPHSTVAGASQRQRGRPMRQRCHALPRTPTPGGCDSARDGIHDDANHLWGPSGSLPNAAMTTRLRRHPPDNLRKLRGGTTKRPNKRVPRAMQNATAFSSGDANPITDRVL